MTSIVWAPATLIIATNQGIEVRFAGVEITDDVPGHMEQVPKEQVPGEQLPGERGIRVHLSAVRSMSTMELDASYDISMKAWAKERKEHGKDSTGRPPIMPGQTVLAPVEAVITDNHDTEYRRVSGQFAGTGTEWDASWVFVPEPPAGVKHLTIEFTLHGELTGKSVRVQLD